MKDPLSLPGRRWLPLLSVASAVTMMAALYAALLYAPTEQSMGDVQRVFYFHLASAWVGFLAFFVAFALGWRHLARPDWRLDAWAAASVEIGVLFCAIVLLSGSLWARPIWNTWWTWDPRLTTTLVLWVYYAGVLALRGSVDEPETRARYTAVLSIIGFINVPLVFMAIRWWRTIHPVILDARGMHLEPAMLVALVAALVAFTLLYATLCLAQVRAAYLRQRVEALQGQMEDRLEKRMARRPGQGAA